MNRKKNDKAVVTAENANVIAFENYGISVKNQSILDFFGGKKDAKECLQLLNRLFDESVEALMSGREIKINHIYENRKTHYAKKPTPFDILVKIVKIIVMRIRESMGVDPYQQLIDKRRSERKRTKTENIDFEKQNRLRKL